MKPVLLILGVLGLAAATYFAVTNSITREAKSILKSECPELYWLQCEYQLTGEQFEKIKSLHEAHDVHCRALCKELSRCQEELREAVQNETTPGPRVQSLLQEWQELRARSQDSIFKHMFEVSAAMDDVQGRRYRAQVYENLILPGRTPHIDADGNFNRNFIQQLGQ